MILPWSMTVRDAFDRSGRQLSVRVDSGDIVITVPPGETARIAPDQAQEFIDAVRAARDELFGASS